MEKLVDALKMYYDYLTTQTRKVSEQQQRLLLAAPQEENAAITTVSGTSGSISSAYCQFEDKLQETPVYEPIWRIPEDQPVDSTSTSRIFMQLCAKQSHFSTRAMRHEFLNRYSRIAKAPPMVL